jgi:hypothetical protein
MKKLFLPIIVLFTFISFGQEECSERVSQYYNYKPSSIDGLSYNFRNYPRLGEKVDPFLKNMKIPAGSSLSSYQVYLFDLMLWREYVIYTSDKFESLQDYFVDSDTLKNGKKILQLISNGKIQKEKLLINIAKYESEFNSLMEAYLSKPNSKNEKNICQWLATQTSLFFEIKRPWFISASSAYTSEEWQKLPIELKLFENSFIPDYYSELKKIADERKFYKENFSKWEEPLAIVDQIHNQQIIILDPNEKKGVKFLCREPVSTGLFLAGTQPGFDWNKANKIAGIVGGDWGISVNLSSNQKEGTECYTVKKVGYDYKVVTTSSLKFSNGEGSINHTFQPKAEYDREMGINKTVKFKIQNDTLFELKSNSWEVVYWASSNNPGFKKGLTREFTLMPGLTRTAYVIGDKNTLPGSKAIALGIGDKTKILLMYYIANNFLDNVAAFELLKTGDEALFIQQENKRLEQAVKKCTYCGKDYSGKTHLATYDEKKYQCDEYEVSNYKEWTKIFCSAKCALDYCRKTKY